LILEQTRSVFLPDKIYLKKPLFYHANHKIRPPTSYRSSLGKPGGNGSE
jgi:hypothetical protein